MCILKNNKVLGCFKKLTQKLVFKRERLHGESMSIIVLGCLRSGMQIFELLTKASDFRVLLLCS